MSVSILIVEDDPRSRKLLADLLSFKGYDVLVAHNGRDGVLQAQTALPDLIILDIQMPLMDGYEAVRTLKAGAQTKGIPVWALTSYAMQADTEKVLAAGCDLCLAKPFDVNRLLQQIEAFAVTRRDSHKTARPAPEQKEER